MIVKRADRLGPIVVCDAGVAPPPGAFAARVTPEGYLSVEGRINGCGVYSYEDSKGKSWGELRRARDVGRTETVNSWAARPLTDDHPPVWVDATNCATYQRGTVTGPRFEADEYTYADMLVTDAKLIAKIRAGKCELSCGYTAVLVAEKGVHNGDAYDFIQTEIHGNHVSVVDVARGGPLCSLIFDAASRCKDSNMPTKPAPKKKDAKIMIKGVEFDVPDEVAAYIAAMEAEDAEEPAEEEKPADTVAAPAAAPAVTADAAQGKIDALTAEVARLKSTESGRIDARVELVTTARKILGADAPLKGKTDAQIHALVVAKVSPSVTLTGKTDEYIAGAYEIALTLHAEKSDSSTHLLDAIGRRTATAPAGLVDLEAVFDAMNGSN